MITNTKIWITRFIPALWKLQNLSRVYVCMYLIYISILLNGWCVGGVFESDCSTILYVRTYFKILIPYLTLYCLQFKLLSSGVCLNSGVSMQLNPLDRLAPTCSVCIFCRNYDHKVLTFEAWKKDDQLIWEMELSSLLLTTKLCRKDGHFLHVRIWNQSCLLSQV